MSSLYTTPQPLGYDSTGDEHRPSRLWASAILCATALGLVVLGGCFLIGSMVMVTGYTGGPQQLQISWQPRSYLLLAMLYIMAFLCFGGALLILILTVKSLLGTIRS